MLEASPWAPDDATVSVQGVGIVGVQFEGTLDRLFRQLPPVHAGVEGEVHLAVRLRELAPGVGVVRIDRRGVLEHLDSRARVPAVDAGDPVRRLFHPCQYLYTLDASRLSGGPDSFLWRQYMT